MNMSYCRFRNTLSDLADCVSALDSIINEGEQVSQVEWIKAQKMRALCERFLDLMDEADNEAINFEPYED